MVVEGEVIGDFNSKVSKILLLLNGFEVWCQVLKVWNTDISRPVSKTLKLFRIKGHVDPVCPRVDGGQVLLQVPAVLVSVNDAPLHPGIINIR